MRAFILTGRLDHATAELTKDGGEAHALAHSVALMHWRAHGWPETPADAARCTGFYWALIPLRLTLQPSQSAARTSASHHQAF